MSPIDLANRFVTTGQPFTEEEREVFRDAINELLPFLSCEMLWHIWLTIDREVRGRNDPCPPDEGTRRNSAEAGE